VITVADTPRLANGAPSGRSRSATFSPDRRYRWSLARRWDPELKPLVAIGLNPSVADALHDDPTIRRVMRYARDWGYGGIIMLNLFARVATDPRELELTTDPIGRLNDRVLVEQAVGHDVLCCWGARGALFGRDHDVITLLRRKGVRAFLCLGLTRDGQPRHPLYLPADLLPMAYRPRHRAVRA
jgi:hypothetical protein